MRGEGIPIACTLPSADAMADRVDEWKALLSAWVVAREPVDGGVRVSFDDAVDMGELVRLVQAEQTCCRFFSFAITVDARGTGLEVRAPEDGFAMVEQLFG